MACRLRLRAPPSALVRGLDRDHSPEPRSTNLSSQSLPIDMRLSATPPIRLLQRRWASARTVAACVAVLVLTSPAAAQGTALESNLATNTAANPIADERAVWKIALTSIPVPDTTPAMPRAAARLVGLWSTSTHALRDSIVVSLARTTVGTPYVRGGESLDRGFDCSGLVRHIMTVLNVDVPRTSSQQAIVGAAVARDTSALRPGDLLVFALAKRRVSHVGVYIGDGRYVHASSVAGRVIESRLDRPRDALVKGWRGARRVLPRGESIEGVAN